MKSRHNLLTEPGHSFPTILHVRQAKTQISLRIRAVLLKSYQDTLWVDKDSKRLRVDSENSD